MPKELDDSRGSINPPLYNSTAFGFPSVGAGREAFEKYGSRFAYGRMGNPSIEPFEIWFAEFEGTVQGAVWATNTGMAAEKLLFEGITSRDLGKGKRIVASPYLYGGTHHLLEWMDRNGTIECCFVENAFDLSSWEMALKSGEPPALVFLETPSNPRADIFDITAIADIVHRYGSRLVVDGTLGIALQNPLLLGADGVIHSVTKYLNRYSTALGGALVVSEDFLGEIEDVFDDLFVHSGCIINPAAALEAYRGHTTLAGDMRHFSRNALRLATCLSCHEAVRIVHYPHLTGSPSGTLKGWNASPHQALARRVMPEGGGGMFSFELPSFKAAVHFVGEQRVAVLAVHLGDANNDLVTHPASTTHAKLREEELSRLGITPSLVRVSVSLKDDDAFTEVIDEFLRVLDTLS